MCMVSVQGVDEVLVSGEGKSATVVGNVDE